MRFFLFNILYLLKINLYGKYISIASDHIAFNTYDHSRIQRQNFFYKNRRRK